MRHLPFILIFTFFILIGITACDIFPDSGPEKDPELINKPEIVDIQKNEKADLEVLLKHGYSSEANIILERKSNGGFNSIVYQMLDGSTLLDRSLDKERETTYLYRFRVEKNGFESEYSNEKDYSYASDFLNAPSNFRATTIENEGVLLEWTDNSKLEDEYVLNKYKEGVLIEPGNISLPADQEDFLDEITNVQNPLSLSYRLQAKNLSRSSEWVSTATIYTGFASPTNLHITDTSYNQFTIEWTDNSGIERNYVVERKKDGEDFQEIARLDWNVTQFVDEITESGFYVYRVKAVRDNLSSNYSNEVSHRFYDLLPPLVAYYPFNGSAVDETGNGHDGDVRSATLTSDRKNQPNSAYLFSGGSYINLAQGGGLIMGPFSISVWIKPTKWNTSSGWSAIINKYSLLGFTPQGWYLGIHPQEGIALTIDSHFFWLGEDVIQLGEWTHIVANYDGSNLELYQDGNFLKSDPTNSPITTNGFCATIGDGSCCLPSSAGCTFTFNEEDEDFFGIIDDIRIYSRALTAEEVEGLYNE